MWEKLILSLSFILALLLIQVPAHAQGLGPELVINGDFNAQLNAEWPYIPGWHQEEMWYIAWDPPTRKGEYLYISLDSYDRISYQQIAQPRPVLNIIPGKSYHVQFDIRDHYGTFRPDGAYASIGGVTIPITYEGHYNETITATSTENLQFVIPPNKLSYFQLDDVSVRELFPIEISREVPETFIAGQAAKITIRVDVNEANLPSGLGIEETIPAGWELDMISEPQYAKYESETGRISWLFWEGGDPVQDTVINYTVIPNNISGEFSGIWMTPAENGSIESLRIEFTLILTVQSEEKDVTAGQPSVFDLMHEDVAIKAVNITPEGDFAGTTVIIKQGAVDGEFRIRGTDKTYILFNISFVSDGEDLGRNITNAVINFTVPKVWITSNNIDPNTVKMHIYDQGLWAPLPTIMTGSSANYYYYHAVASHLSEAAITGNVFTGMVAPGFEPGLITIIITVIFISVLISFKGGYRIK